MPILSSTEPAQEIVRCIEHSDTLHLGFPGQSRLTIARRDTIWVGGEQFWEAWCTGPYPTNGFHRQAFDRAKEHGELYVYRRLEEGVGGALIWEGLCGKCEVGVTASSAFSVMDRYVQHTCRRAEPGQVASNPPSPDGPQGSVGEEISPVNTEDISD